MLKGIRDGQGFWRFGGADVEFTIRVVDYLTTVTVLIFLS